MSNTVRRPHRIVSAWTANAYAHREAPIGDLVTVAQDLLAGQRADPTGGCTHFYSPQAMPGEGDRTQNYDVAGGLELVPPATKRTYRPGWALTMEYVDVPAVRPSFFKFYRHRQG